MKTEKAIIPTEEQEQIKLVDWLDKNRVVFSALPFSTFTKSWKVKNRNKRMGVRPGVPDILILWKCKDGKKRVVFLELKRTQKYKVSDFQKHWIERLNECEEVGSFCAIGFDHAKKILQSL